jgi:hypothetical protein
MSYGLLRSAQSFLGMVTVLLLMPVCCFGSISYQQPKQEHRMIQELTDAELVEMIASRQWDQRTAAAEEIVKRGERMIPLLIKRKGDKRALAGDFTSGDGGSAVAISVPTGNESNDRILMKEGKFVTVEVAALYLITAIYWDSLNIAQGPYLTDLSLPEIKRREANTEKLIKRAWKSVDSWVKALNKEGMDALRAKKHAPLDDGNLGFW